MTISNIKFNPGQLVMTCGVNDKIADDADFAKFVLSSIKRHLSGDWGEMSNEDKEANDIALSEEHSSRLFSAYKYNNIKIWIITEYDRSYTTVLFPSEY